MHVLLAENDCAPSAQAADHVGVFGGNAVFLRRAEQGAGGGRGDSGNINNVFESDGDAVQRAEMLSVVDFPLGVTGAVKSGFGGDRNVSVERWIELLDARQAVVSEFNRRDIAIAEFQA